MKKDELENKINQVYEFTLDYIDNYGYPPSVREICSKLSIKSTATAYSYLERLKTKGLLDKSPMKKRAITPTNRRQSFKGIPIVGLIHAGTPVFAVENLEGYCPLPQDFNNENDEYFALNVKGESMINAGIYNNDIIIVKKQEDAENGQIIVALIDDSATVKRYYKKQDCIVLHPENDQMKDMIFNDIKILGIVKGLYRKM